MRSASEKMKFLLNDADTVLRLPMLREASPSSLFGRLLTMLMTPPTARLPQRLEPPPRTISTRAMDESGSLNHWMVE